jgi:flagellin
VSLAQTAEGALGAMTSSLQRMRELALQSANATNSDIDRVAINAEVQQLKDEIDRLAEKTNFNGTKLLDGSFSNVNFQIGANEGESLSFSVNEVSGSTLGVGSDAGLSSFSTSTALAKGDLTINGISIEASRSASDTASVDNQAASAIAKAAAINLSEEDTGVRAMANTNTVAGANMTVSNGATGQIMINNVVISVNTGGNDLASDRSSVITAINSAAEQTGVVAIDSEDDAIGVILQAKDGRNITINSTANVALGSAGLTPGDTLAELGLANTGTYEGTITLTSSNGEDITISPGSGNVENTGFIEGTYAARSAIMNSNIQASGSAFEWDGNPDFDASGTGANVDFDLDITTSAGVGNVQITLTADLSPATTTALVSEFNTQIAADGDTNGVIEAYVIDEDDFVFGFRALSNEPDQAITVTANDVNVAGAFGMPQTGDTAVVSGTKSPLDSGDLVINGVQIGAAKSTDDTASDDTYNSSLKAASGIATAIAVNKSSDETGVSATVNSTSVTGSSAQGPAGESGQLYLNGVDIGVFTSSTNDELDKASAISQINLFTGQTGVTAEDNGSGISMIATDGRNISAAWNTDQNDSAVELSAAHFGIGGAGEIDFDTNDDATLEYTAAGIAKTTYSTVQFTSAGPINIEAGSNGTQALFNLGFDAGSFGGSEGGQLIKDVDVSSVEGALKAINGIDNALDQINLERANLGAIQNRFESTINNQAITAENFEQANSRIRDADFAAETAELSRTQVLQSAGLSILAQANGQPQQVLQLLQG